ncbi:ROK family protein [Candidatus Saccharibacteria bacterium]|nr:ROK family protein [Candidatus Saccharibacteria bacterium]
MYLAIDIGGSKTLLGVFTDKGNLKESLRFATPKQYDDFLASLLRNLRLLKTDDFKAVCLAAPGRIDYENGVGIRFGNLDWENVPLKKDVENLTHSPTIVENDARLAGLSEAKNIMKKYKKVLYITISTGIGYSLIVNGVINQSIGTSGGRGMVFERNGRSMPWEEFASGKAITKQYGLRASDIDDPTIWKAIVRNFAVGITELIATLQPEVVIFGGGVGAHFDKFGSLLQTELKRFATPMTPVPPLLMAKRPEEAVIYGCFELAKDEYGHAA